ncbi:MAG: Ig-like domain-containing protein [Lachnospiraceae bacterium]|nr:Ig-like domain-containing protein [Lachnospiraceae bacterium]
MKSLFKKCIVVLGFVLFFALFPSTGELISANAKEIDEPATETAVLTETQAEIKLSVKTKSLVKDLQYELKVYNLSESQKAYFKSSFPRVASVDDNGIIYGNSNGVTVITVTIKEGSKTVETLSCEVTVGPPAINVKWIKSEVVLVVGKRVTLKKIILPYNTAESAKFFSADTDVVTVNSSGRITAKEIGVTYVFTAIDNGKFDFCKVTVVDEETYQKMLEEAEKAGTLIETVPDESEDPDDKALVNVTEEE